MRTTALTALVALLAAGPLPAQGIPAARFDGRPALTDDDIDGFSFRVDKDATILRFVLNIDGQERPGAVEIGANNMKIRNLPLFVNLR